MRVLLAFAPYRHDMLYPDSMGRRTVLSRERFGRIGGVTPPLGILTLAAILLRAGHDVRVLMGIFETQESFLARTREFAPDVIGFNTMYFSWPHVRALLPRIREVLPRAKLICGGPHATALGVAMLAESEALDAVVQGEGEDTIVSLCEALVGDGDPSRVPGVAWRENGVLHAGTGPVYARDLDAIPYPAYDLVDLKRFVPAIGSYNRLPSVNIMTSRGCPKRCIFCISHGHLRYSSVERAMGEIRHVVGRYGVRHLIFFDENFTTHRARALEIAGRLRAERLRLSFVVNSRVDTVDAELLTALKKAGCWQVLYGAESGVQRNLDALGKGQTLAQITEAVRAARRAGLQVRAMFMLGLPGETFDEGLETIRFAVSLDPDMASFNNFTPLPGAPIWERIESMGTLHNTGATHRINFVPHTMTRDELAELNRLAFRRFYLRPRYIIRRALAIRSVHDLVRYARGFFAFIGLRNVDPAYPDAGTPPAGDAAGHP